MGFAGRLRIEASVGSRGDSYDNALVETINGLYKAEVIYRRGPWKNMEAVEYATLEWVDWFNHRWSWKRRIIATSKSRPRRPDSNKTVSGIPGAVQGIHSHCCSVNCVVKCRKLLIILAYRLTASILDMNFPGCIAEAIPSPPGRRPG